MTKHNVTTLRYLIRLAVFFEQAQLLPEMLLGICMFLLSCGGEPLSTVERCSITP
jgi:hypothetical protein